MAVSIPPSSFLPEAVTTETPLPEFCLTPEAWSIKERPIAKQSSATTGSVHTHYRDPRSIRVHTLSWNNASAVERALILQGLPSEIGATSGRFRWTTPRYDRIVVTMLAPPTVTRTHHGTGSITIELEEALRQNRLQAPSRATWWPGLFYTPGGMH